MITGVANAGKASAFQKIAEGGKNVVNKVKEFVRSGSGQAIMAGAVLVAGAVALGMTAGHGYGEHYAAATVDAARAFAGVVGGIGLLSAGLGIEAQIKDRKNSHSV